MLMDVIFPTDYARKRYSAGAHVIIVPIMPVGARSLRQPWRNMTDLNNAPAYSPAPPAYAAQSTVSNKSFVANWLLALLLGTLGIDRFYLGKIGTGILKLITFGGFGIWSLVDVILALTGSTRDKQGLPLAGYQENKKIAIIVTLILVVLSAISSGISTATYLTQVAG